ncbi:Virulence sensor protein BvgS [compost metagenome]
MAFDQADVFLGDTISAHYLISQGNPKNVKMTNFGMHEPVGFSFALRSDEQTLLQLVNATLAAVPISTRESIFKRWSAGSDILLTDHRLQLTRREEQWIASKPVVRVLVADNLAPLSFLDDAGNHRGISADLLELIRLRTGLRFETQHSSSMSDMVERVARGEADLIASASASPEYESALEVTRPYFENSNVLLTRKSAEPPIQLDPQANHRLAVSQGNPLIPYLREHYPHIQLTQTRDELTAAMLLLQDQVDGAVSSLIIANHITASAQFREQLVITSTIGTEQAAYALAFAPGTKELGSILDKALLSIAPDELGIINSRWRGYSPADNGYWHTHQRLIYQVIGGTGLLLLLSLVWNAHMRRQIKQREQAERALNDQLAFMRALVNGTPHPIYVRDREGLLKTCNDSYLHAFSCQREDISGRTVLDSVLGDKAQAQLFHADYLQVMASGQPLIQDRPLTIGDRSLTIYHWILPYRDSLGVVQGVIGGWIDISERRQLIEDLRQAKDQADDANRAKSTFLATMSHEIRTPMNAVIGMLELTLKRADQGHLDRAAIEVAYDSAKDLLELIGDILDIARIESGRLTLHPERVNLRALVDSVARVFDGLARQKQLSLVLALDPRADQPVLIDPLRFKQILSNLISNAIKFTEHGQVCLHLQLQPEEQSGRAMLDLRVKDSGIGIRAADQQRLFKPFAQAEPDGQLARSGTGLGLIICRTLCSMMGGQLTLSSQHGEGTEVRISMPIKCLEPIAQVEPEPEQRQLLPLPALDVLVIDDHPANRLLMSQQLHYLQLAHTTAQNGEEGLDLWRDGSFDVVIVDCSMPLMNGYDLTRAIRDHEQRCRMKPCTILGYTANAQPEERERCLRAGMDDCLFKPTSLAVLGQRLAMIAKRTELTSGQSGPIFCVAAAGALTGDDPKMLDRLFTEVLHSSGQDQVQLRNMPLQDNQQGLLAMAHKIKGAARIVQAGRLIDCCEKLEACLQRPHDDQEIETMRQRTLAAMQELEHALSETLKGNQASCADGSPRTVRQPE